ncbi:glycosyltransferase family 4 protein [Massilia niastensis]|uniref:glycosyltransferase family 4 protein n=1 Tax=Massilia niastensis TaxID=544911 RepID=UPI0003A0F8C2|nr:glycosyltransferase family 4 protein [Massilia niastensis]
MSQAPVFAFVTMGSGDFLGATVRDLALANMLHRRGYKVVVYWMMETNEEMADPGIVQRVLCHGTRYHFGRPSWLLDRVLGRLLFLLPKPFRVRVVQGRSGYVDRLLGNMVGALYGRAEGDRALARRLADFLARDGATHLMMSYASIGPLALAAKQMRGGFEYLLTFQGDEQFAAHAKRLGLLEPFRARLGEVLRGSPWPAIAVSADYIDRIVEELAVPRKQLEVVYNGVELPKRDSKASFARLKAVFPGLSPHYPMVVYLGRQDVEKGVDLLLYAARQLAGRKLPMQLVICGSTAKGTAYRKVLADLAEHLGLAVFHAGSVPNEVRDALFAHSHCVVYPSVNREPFGLVVAEAMSHGAPVLVPDYGGIGEVIQQGGKAGGLTFKAWDSGDLARQLERLLVDKALHRGLVANTRAIAARFSLDNMTDDVLAHVGLGEQPRLAQAGGA